MKTCLVMGAGGFIGKSLCKELAKSYKVKAYDIKQVEELSSVKNIELLSGNFITTQDFTKELENVDVVYHLISTTLPTEETHHIPDEIEENIIPTVRLLESMVKNNVYDIIFSSSGGTVYGEKGDHVNSVEDSLNPICSYGVQKKVIEAYLEFYSIRYGINYKIARISNPYGLGQDPNKPQGVIPIFIHRLLNNESITIFGDGNNERDYIYMDDLVAGLIKLEQYEGNKHIFNLGCGEAHSLNQIIEIIKEFAHKDFSSISYKPMRKCDVSKTLLEINKSQQELQWKAATTIEKGIKFILDYYESHNQQQ